MHVADFASNQASRDGRGGGVADDDDDNRRLNAFKLMLMELSMLNASMCLECSRCTTWKQARDRVAKPYPDRCRDIVDRLAKALDGSSSELAPIVDSVDRVERAIDGASQESASRGTIASPPPPQHQTDSQSKRQERDVVEWDAELSHHFAVDMLSFVGFFGAAADEPRRTVATLLSHGDLRRNVALCGESVSRFVQSYYGRDSASPRTGAITRAVFAHDLYVYGATSDERLAAFRGVVNALVERVRNADEAQPVFVVADAARSNGWTFTHSSWNRPVRVVLTAHATLCSVLDAFDIDASRVAWRYRDNATPCGGNDGNVGMQVVAPKDDADAIKRGTISSVRALTPPSHLVKYYDMGWRLDDKALRPHELVVARRAIRDFGGSDDDDLLDDLAMDAMRKKVRDLAPPVVVPVGADLASSSVDTNLTLMSVLFPNATRSIAAVWHVTSSSYIARSRRAKSTPCKPYDAIIGALLHDRMLAMPDDDDRAIDADDVSAAGSRYRVLSADQSMEALFIDLYARHSNASSLLRAMTPDTVCYRRGELRWRAPLMRIGEARIVGLDYASRQDNQLVVTLEFDNGSEANRDHAVRRYEWRRSLNVWLNARIGGSSLDDPDAETNVAIGGGNDAPSEAPLPTTTTMSMVCTQSRTKACGLGAKRCRVGDWIQLDYFVHHLWRRPNAIAVWHQEGRIVAVKPLHPLVSSYRQRSSERVGVANVTVN